MRSREKNIRSVPDEYLVSQFWEKISLDFKWGNCTAASATSITVGPPLCTHFPTTSWKTKYKPHEQSHLSPAFPVQLQDLILNQHQGTNTVSNTFPLSAGQPPVRVEITIRVGMWMVSNVVVSLFFFFSFIRPCCFVPFSFFPSITPLTIYKVHRWVQFV